MQLERMGSRDSYDLVCTTSGKLLTTFTNFYSPLTTRMVVYDSLGLFNIIIDYHALFNHDSQSFEKYTLALFTVEGVHNTEICFFY